MTTCPSGPHAWDFSCPPRDLEIEVGMPPAAGRDPTCQPSNAGRPPWSWARGCLPGRCPRTDPAPVGRGRLQSLRLNKAHNGNFSGG